MAWSPLQELVTLDQFKQHLKLSLDVDTEDEDLQLKLLIAHEMCLDFITQRLSTASATAWVAVMDAWTADTVPRRVIAAILAQGGYLYRRRGDDDSKPPTREQVAICPDAEQCLMSLRDPAVS